MLPKEKLERINELARKAKAEGLTPAEKSEQIELRREYIQAFRASFRRQLMGIAVIDPSGRDVTPKKLKREQERYKRKH